MSDQNPIESQDVIAVIGMSCRFPGASNPAEFWENLKNGIESISLFSDEEALAAGTDRATINHPSFVRAGGILDGIDLFDAPFFGFTPREAEILDPQQRLFLECSWEALEDAGHDTEGFDGLVGVFAGSAMSTYLFNLMSNRAVMA